MSSHFEHRLAIYMKEIQPPGRICVSVCAETAHALREAIARAVKVGDVVELRLDYLRGAELDKALRELDATLDSNSSTFIITLRPVEQGGEREIDSLNRLVFWLERLGNQSARTEFADVELDLARLLMEKEDLNWERIICSFHDFAGTHTDLNQLYEEMAATPARIIKIAVPARDITDCIPVFKLMERARAEGREVIALAMGAAGMLTRILGPSRGSLLTYGSLDAETPTAPGQPTAEDLRALYRVHKITDATAVMGLVGQPVQHSVSPHMHNASFEAREVDAVYVPFEVRDASEFMRRMVHPTTREINWNLRGLGVTAPHKRSVMPHLDWIEPAARKIGAVNTIVVQGNELHGYNTDAAALLPPLEKRVGKLSGKRVALIGGGGAALAALYALEQAGGRVTVFARSHELAAPLAEKFGAACERLEGAHLGDFEVVINATPLGTRGACESATPVTAAQLRGARIVYDLVYNPPETRLQQEAREAGCETFGGAEMLVAQAAEQFRLWTGKDAPVEVMQEALKRALSEAAEELK